ncbi:MAG TPA: RNA methyltransferase [Acidimicrobiales bacterium]|nr:RNA methyltransferase [Acidimicrobiales bacterium]
MRRLRRLLRKRAARWSEGVFVAEGLSVVRSALAAGVPVESLYLAAGSALAADVATIAEAARAVGARIYELAPGVLERVADTVTPQPVLAVVPMAAGDLEALAGGRLVVVMAGVRDPGNAGTVLRSADAAGADGVVCCGSTVDPYNPKTVRSSAGSLFHVPVVVAGGVAGTLDALRTLGYRRLGAVVQGGVDYTTVDWSPPTALVLGNEASGLDAAARPHLDELVGVPMAGRAESLNVGVACAVLCFEALRQRRAAAGGDAGSTMPGVTTRRDPA